MPEYLGAGIGTGLTKGILNYEQNARDEEDRQRRQRQEDQIYGQQKTVFDQAQQDRQKLLDQEYRKKQMRVLDAVGEHDQPGTNLVPAEQVKQDFTNLVDTHHPEPQPQASREPIPGEPSLAEDYQAVPDVPGVQTPEPRDRGASGRVKPLPSGGKQPALQRPVKGLAPTPAPPVAFVPPQQAPEAQAAQGVVGDTMLKKPSDFTIGTGLGMGKALRDAASEVTAQHAALEQKLANKKMALLKKHGYGTDKWNEKNYIEEMNDYLDHMQGAMDANQKALNELHYKITENAARSVGPMVKMYVNRGDFESAAKLYEDAGLQPYADTVRSAKLVDGSKLKGASQRGVPYVVFGDDPNTAMRFEDFKNGLDLNQVEKDRKGDADQLAKSNTTVIVQGMRDDKPDQKDERAKKAAELHTEADRLEKEADGETNPVIAESKRVQANQNRTYANGLVGTGVGGGKTKEQHEAEFAKRDRRISELLSKANGKDNKTKLTSIAAIEAELGAYEAAKDRLGWSRGTEGYRAQLAALKQGVPGGSSITKNFGPKKSTRVDGIVPDPTRVPKVTW